MWFLSARVQRKLASAEMQRQRDHTIKKNPRPGRESGPAGDFFGKRQVGTYVNRRPRVRQSFEISGDRFANIRVCFHLRDVC